MVRPLRIHRLLRIWLLLFLIAPSAVVAGELHDAVVANDLARVKALVASGADVNDRGLLGVPLNLAGTRGNLEIAQVLVDAGASLGAPEFPLHNAAENGQAKMAALLIKRGADANALDTRGRTPLIVAILAGGGLEVLRTLLEAGADPGKSGRAYGMNALHWAAARGTVAEAELLLSTGVDINIRETGGDQFTALHNAVTHGQLAVVRLLIDRGADINIPDNNGMTPLAHAAGEIRETLIKAGAK